jgi:glycosyltransferase involved in cell wall biosynthesis
VPFEAAFYGVPTVTVAFGAVAEFLPALPVAPASWAPADFAAAVAELAADASLAQEQVASVRRAARDLTWDRTASIVLAGYRELLARPARA